MIDAYPLQWPEGYQRTKSPKRSRFGRRTGAYGSKPLTLAQAREKLEAEVRRLGATQLVISTNMPIRKDGGVYSNAREPDDSGVAVYFKRKGKDICIPCDTYSYVWENTYAIARCIAAMRQIERDGIPGFLDRAFTGFAALPDPEVVTSWRAVLGVPESGTLDDARRAFRELAKRLHPDAGGTNEEFGRIRDALQQAEQQLEARR